MPERDSDSLDDFWIRARNGAGAPADAPEVRPGRSGLLKAGKRVNFVEVIGPKPGPVGAFGRRVNNRRAYDCRCIAPTGPDGKPCGNPVEATYYQLYYGHVYSCGCKERHKRPPLHLDNKRFGYVEVLYWDENEGCWDAVCHECGTHLCLKNVRAVREAGKSCAGHTAAAHAATSTG